MHQLAKTYRQTPSEYLLGPAERPTPIDLYWRWAIDDACRICALVVAERERKAAADKAAGVTTYRVKRAPTRRSKRRRKNHP